MGRPPRCVLVTGASSGIGRATAELLAARGFQVLAGVRHLAGANSSDNATVGGGSLEHVLLDVTRDEQVAAVVERISRIAPDGLYGLVNNAGVGPPGAVELTPIDELRYLFEVNSIAPLRLIQSCLPLLRRTRGRIVNISSMNGTIVLPMVGAYSASKFALEAISDALRVELRPWGISVSLVRPGQIQTAIFDKARTALAERTEQIPPELKQGYSKLYLRAAHFNERGAQSKTSAEKVARAVLKALEARRPRVRYLVGLDAWLLQGLRDLVPTRLADFILARVSGADGNGRLP